MTTTVISSIRSSGGDYSSLSAWEAGEQSDLVTADEISVAECYDDWTSGLEDVVEIAGWTTSTTNFIKVTAADDNAWCDASNGAVHQKYTDSTYDGFTILDNVNAPVVEVNQSHVIIERLRIINDGNSLAYPKAIQVGASTDVTIDSCDFDCYATKYPLAFSAISGSSTKLINSYVQSISIPTFNVAHKVYNCVFANGGTSYGIYFTTGSGDCDIKNCLLFNQSTDVSRSDAGLDYNATTKTDVSSNLSGSNNVYEVDSTNSDANSDLVDPSAGDFHIKGGSVLDDAGVNLIGYLNNDIDGDEYPSTGDWPIGFDYLAAGGGAPTLSSPGVINVLSDRATPQVTLTF